MSLQAGKIYKWPEPCNQSWRFYCVKVENNIAYGFGHNEPKLDWSEATSYPERYYKANERDWPEAEFNLNEFNKLCEEFEE